MRVTQNGIDLATPAQVVIALKPRDIARLLKGEAVQISPLMHVFRVEPEKPRGEASRD